MNHPLDRAVWNALTTRLSSFTTPESDAHAVRIDPEIGEAFLRMMGVNQIANPLKPPQVDPKPQDGAKL